MNIHDFSLVVSAERKMEKGEPLTEEEKAAIKKHGITSKKICACGCGKSMEPRVDGVHHQIDGKDVNSDCYFEKFGAEIDSHPIFSPRFPLGASLYVEPPSILDGCYPFRRRKDSRYPYQ